MTARSITSKNINADAKLSPSEKQPSSDAQPALQTPPISPARAFRRAVGVMLRWITIGAMTLVTLAWIATLFWLLVFLVGQII